MVSILINGIDSSVPVLDLPRFSDLIEVVRSSIDPNHMITEIVVDGQQLADEDWRKSPRAFGDAVIEISTDTPDQYIAARVLDAPEAVQVCFLQFRDARKTFQSGDSRKGNQKFAQSVHTLRAFFEWYQSLMQLMTKEQRVEFSLDSHIHELTASCNTICQQQLYQQWLALADTIEHQLEPGLDKLETHCRALAKKVH